MSTSNEISETKWITQAEAAKLRGVSRQAINQLIKRGKVKTMKVSNVTFVDKTEMKQFVGSTAGRPRKKK